MRDMNEIFRNDDSKNSGVINGYEWMIQYINSSLVLISMENYRYIYEKKNAISDGEDILLELEDYMAINEILDEMEMTISIKNQKEENEYLYNENLDETMPLEYDYDKKHILEINKRGDYYNEYFLHCIGCSSTSISHNKFLSKNDEVIDEMINYQVEYRQEFEVNLCENCYMDYRSGGGVE